jgi:hypothetical protein|tara:strand:+ start:2665 stop:2847 length:183 start_codon:yes stop_codon:yes gene_type:complete
MEILVEIFACAFFFVLGWLIGIERKNILIKELTFWQAYAREKDTEWEEYVENQTKLKTEK